MRPTPFQSVPPQGSPSLRFTFGYLHSAGSIDLYSRGCRRTSGTRTGAVGTGRPWLAAPVQPRPSTFYEARPDALGPGVWHRPASRGATRQTKGFKAFKAFNLLRGPDWMPWPSHTTAPPTHRSVAPALTTVVSVQRVVPLVVLFRVGRSGTGAGPGTLLFLGIRIVRRAAGVVQRHFLLALVRLDRGVFVVR